MNLNRNKIDLAKIYRPREIKVIKFPKGRRPSFNRQKSINIEESIILERKITVEFTENNSNDSEYLKIAHGVQCLKLPEIKNRYDRNL